MTKYTVTGAVLCFLTYEVDVPQEKVDEIKDHGGCLKDYIIDRAYDTFGGVTNYMGNGGTDKLVGVSDYEATIYASEEYTFDDVEGLED